MRTYTTVDDFLKENKLDRFNEHEKCFERVVEELDFNTCKQILLSQLELDGVTIEKLKEKFRQDKYLNNIYKHRSGLGWKWDLIGDEMLYNRNAKIKFKLMSDCNRTCIAKACAKMIVEDYND